MYGSEIWNVHKAPQVEQVHLDYCKVNQGVKRTTTRVMIYYELGRFPFF